VNFWYIEIERPDGGKVYLTFNSQLTVLSYAAFLFETLWEASKALNELEQELGGQLGNEAKTITFRSLYQERRLKPREEKSVSA
jgi:hypothetical protein